MLIVGTFIIDVYGSLTVDVPLKLNLIVLALCDFNVSMNWLFFGGLVEIETFWKTRDFWDGTCVRSQWCRLGGWYITYYGNLFRQYLSYEVSVVVRLKS